MVEGRKPGSLYYNRSQVLGGFLTGSFDKQEIANIPGRSLLKSKINYGTLRGLRANLCPFLYSKNAHLTHRGSDS